MPEPAQVQPDPDRDAVLADMAAWRAGGGGKTPEAPEPKADTVPEAEAKPDPAAEAKPEPDPAPKAEAKPAEPKPDPEVDRKHRAIKEAEKASRQAIAAERQAALDEIAKERESLPLAEVEAFKKALAQVNRNPVALFEALGVKRDRFGAIAQAFHAASDEGAKDPRYKELAEKALREREERDEVAALRARLDERDRLDQEREATARAERDAEVKLGKIYKAARASQDAPLLARLFAKDAEKAEAKLANLTLSLFEELGEFPDPEDVIATYEKRRRAELEEEGVDVDALLKPTPKQTNQAAEEKRPARTLPNDPSTSTPVRRGDLSDAEERDVILAEIAKLNASAAGA